MSPAPRSQDGVSWAQLPSPTAEDMANCMKLPATLMLSGDVSAKTPLPAEPVAEGGARRRHRRLARPSPALPVCRAPRPPLPRPPVARLDRAC